jgi:hypothetical protein
VCMCVCVCVCVCVMERQRSAVKDGTIVCCASRPVGK